jgi:predicted DCC family thiol-disulfide oxidoreductase YuxK
MGGDVDRPVLLYDGYCGFCDATVQLVLREDRRRLIRFAPLHGRLADELAARGHPIRAIDSLALVEHASSPSNARVFFRSEALCRLARHLGWPWNLLRALVVVPRPLRDWAYDQFARRRYRMFGRLHHCTVPRADDRSRFLD